MSVFIVSSHEPTTNKIKEVLVFAGRECPPSQILAFDQAAAKLAKEQPELVVVVLPPEIERGLAVLGTIRAAVGACRVLAVGPASESKLVIRALRSGADDYIDANDVEVELDAALARLGRGGDSGGEPARLIAVLSPTGGCGSSTLAVNVASCLAKEHKTVCLIDMKLHSGDLAALLDLRPAFTLADLCQNLSRLDRVMFERSLVRHASGVQLLAPPRLYEDVPLVSVEGVNQAVAQARALFPYVVADLDHTFADEQNVVLRQADVVLLVLRLDFTSLRNTRRTIEHLERLGVDRARIRLVVNRHGQAKEVPSSKAEEALGMKITHFIPEDPKTVNRANNNGVPVVLESPSSRVSKSVAKLAVSVNGRHKAH